MFFGDVSAVGAYEGDPRVELHGPGYSKILIGEDRIRDWSSHIDLIVASIADNGGRSCVNASGVWAPAQHAEAVAEALAAKLAQIVPRAADDERAMLAPFADPRVAERISQQIDAGLADAWRPRRHGQPSSRDPGSSTVDGCTYLQPTIVLCDSPEHPLANREFLFPFAAVVRGHTRRLPVDA